MSNASQLFWKTREPSLMGPGNKEALELLKSAASQWRDTGNYFNAGYAIDAAHLAAWGDGEQIWSCITAALQDYKSCVETQERCSHDSMVALLKWSAVLTKLHTYYFRESIESSTRLYSTRKEILEDLAQRLVSCFGHSSHADNYLVKGFLVESNLKDNWEPSFPKHETQWGVERWNLNTNILTIEIPSAFQLFVSLGDYHGANIVIKHCPNAFTTPGLRGWKAAVQGFLKPDESPHWFTKAANAFAEDTQPSSKEERKQRGDFWSSINIDLWAKYFRSRAVLATVVIEPNRAKELIQTAATEIGDELRWADKEVFKYQLLVQTLAHLVDEESGLTPEQARSRFLKQANHVGMGEDSDDPMVKRFLALSVEVFEGFKKDPVGELISGRLPNALDALGRIPLIGPRVAEVAKHPISTRATQILIENAPLEVFETTSTWIYRTLESIRGKKGEDKLRKIILRLIQSSLPLYAQIVHGPIEWGKDIIALVEIDNHLELRMYQAKCGDMTTPDWRIARSQLEEMFQAPIPKVIVSDEIAPSHVGFLIYNGHPKPHVAPLMDGWLDEQRRDHKRKYEFIHLDKFVRWIIDDGLLNDFRQAIAEVGLEPVK